MRAKFCIICVLTAFAASCTLLNSDGGGTKKGRSGTGSDEGPIHQKAVYLTGVEFPESYDWKQDSAYEDVGFKLRHFIDGKQVHEVSSLTGLVSSDPDQHWSIGGHLWTESMIEDETVICRDGKEMLRYPGREILKGILIRPDTIFTLGVRQSGDGLVFRMNGKELIHDGLRLPAGDLCDPSSPNGAIYEDGDDICYSSFSISDAYREWMEFRDSSLWRLSPPPGEYRILDARKIDGHLCFVLSDFKGDGPYLAVDGKIRSLKSGAPAVLRNCHLASDQGRIFIRGEKRFAIAEEWTTAIWTEAGEMLTMGTGGSPYGLQIENGDFAAVLIGKGNRVSGIFHKVLHTLPDTLDVRMLSPACASLSEGRFRVALTSYGGKDISYVWNEGVLEPIRIHGFLSSLKVE